MAGRAITIQFLGDARSFNRTADQVQGKTSTLGSKFSKFGTVAKLGMGAAAAGMGLVVKNSIGLEAEFSKTMNVLGATLDAPQKQMDQLKDLAMKMGAETVFSANDASKAMLELARGGMSAATIQGGALKGTLTLAAAGEMEMGEAANTAVKAMGAFNLKGKDMDAVAAALAGGANASAASVSDMSQALSQGGLAAHAAGLSLQETTAILASFSNHGLNGSDAGTSLKTMLNSLVPATDKAQNAMNDLNLTAADGTPLWIKANGEYKSAAQIAGILKRGTEGLASSERNRLITQAFGTDAQRAANILADEGAKGLTKLLKATSDTGAAQKMAAANMKGTAGAIERLKGAAETAQLMLGQALAPVVVKIANFLSGTVIPAVTGFIASLQKGGGEGSKFGAIMQKTFAAVAKIVREVLPQIAAMVRETVTSIQILWKRFGGILTALTKGTFKNLFTVIKGAFTVIRGVFKVFSSLLKGDWKGVWQGIKLILSGAFNVMKGLIKQFFTVAKALFRIGWSALKGIVSGAWDGIKTAVANGVGRVVDLIRSLPGKIRDVGGNMLEAGKALIGKLFDGILAAAKNPGGFVGDLVNSIKRAINSALHLPLDINFDKGPIHIHATLIPAFPAYAKGTSFAKGGLALVGEEGPELAELPRGTRVRTAAQTGRMLGSGGGDIYITINGALDPVAVGRQVEQAVNRYRRSAGRPVLA